MVFVVVKRKLRNIHSCKIKKNILNVFPEKADFEIKNGGAISINGFMHQ